MFPIWPLLLLVVLALPGALAAQSASLFPQSVDGAQRQPIIGTRNSGGVLPAMTASLVNPAPRHSFLAPLPDRPEPLTDRSLPRSWTGGSAAEKLRDLISEAESGAGGYDAVNHGARVKPPGPPSQLTVQEIYVWIDATPGQPHAIGRYQFIPATLRRLMSAIDADPRSRFSPDLQDRLADELLIEAGLMSMQRGEMTRRSFMYRLAKIWAGLPLPSGESYYEGYAGNKATMTWARFDGAMAQIFPG